MNKRINRLLVLSLAIVMAFVAIQIPQKVSAEPSMIILNVQRFEQEQTKWCWAAGAKMIGHFYGYTTNSQTSIVLGTLGYAANVTASDSEIRTAINYALSGSKTVTNVMGTKSLYQFKMNIMSGNPAALKIHWNTGGNHLVICKGYSSSDLVIIDPGMGCSAINSYPYTDLINGTTLLSGTGTYINTFWIQ